MTNIAKYVRDDYYPVRHHRLPARAAVGAVQPHIIPVGGGSPERPTCTWQAQASHSRSTTYSYPGFVDFDSKKSRMVAAGRTAAVEFTIPPSYSRPEPF
ncbi:hypothetical protein SCUP234_08914 [Seiridium cupressi]